MICPAVRLSMKPRYFLTEIGNLQVAVLDSRKTNRGLPALEARRDKLQAEALRKGIKLTEKRYAIGVR